ncbi:MAG: hypothetical protein K6U74_04910 [Firmicutes bacterium]|nr:hypothetical protein [Bacillota bacterium]
METKSIIVACKHCGTKNRVKPHSDNLRPICGYCRKVLIKEPDIKQTKTTYKQRMLGLFGRQSFLRALAWTVIILIAGWILLNKMNKPVITPATSNSSIKINHSHNNQNQSKTTFDQPVQPLPENGTFTRYFNGEAIAPLEIVTMPGSTNYFVKVLDWQSKKEILTVFVRAGQKVDVNLPVGSYEIKYASGSTWYGENYLFGPDTSYRKADKRFDFTKSGNHVSGYTIELYLQPRGNLSTRSIKPEEF